MAGDGAEFKAAVLVPCQQELQLQTVPLAIAAFPAKAGAQLIRALGTVAPLLDLKHLKRVRKAPDDGSLLEAILCTLPEDSDVSMPDASSSPAPAPLVQLLPSSCDAPDITPDRLPAPLQELYTHHGGVRLRCLHGAAAPPQSRQQWEAWTKLWPITWRVPEHGTPVTEETPVDAATQRYFQHHMARVLQLAASAGADNAALIVEPPALTPLAEAADGSAVHPLHHAVMAVIQAASERDLAMWPPSAADEGRDSEGEAAVREAGDGGCGGSGSGGEEEGGERRLVCPAAECSDMPQGKGVAQQQQQQEQKQGQPCGSQGGGGSGDAAHQEACLVAARTHHGSSCSGQDGGCQAGEGEGQLASKRPRLGEAPQADAAGSAAAAAAAVAGSRPYMCTGYDCFVVREPCIMCAMALVHSRVQRVIYCRPDAAFGALGGCRRLHACRSLNHNYEVYRMELKERD